MDAPAVGAALRHAIAVSRAAAAAAAADADDAAADADAATAAAARDAAAQLSALKDTCARSERARDVVLKPVVGADKLGSDSVAGVAAVVAVARQLATSAATAAAARRPETETALVLACVRALQVVNNAVFGSPGDGSGLRAVARSAADLVGLVAGPAPASAAAVALRMLQRLLLLDPATAAREVIDDATSQRVLVAALAQCMRAPLFPEGRGRCELACELLKLLFAVADSLASKRRSSLAPPHAATTVSVDADEALASLCVVTTDALVRAAAAVDHHGDHHAREAAVTVENVAQLAAQVLMHAPDDAGSGFAAFAFRRGAVAPLLSMLKSSASRVAVERTSDGEMDVVPVLVVLLNLVSRSPKARHSVASALFPATATATWSGAGGIDPVDAPPGTLRGNVVALMRSANSRLKRYSGEFVFALADGDEDIFKRWVGLGNAAPVLRVRGVNTDDAGAPPVPASGAPRSPDPPTTRDTDADLDGVD